MSFELEFKGGPYVYQLLVLVQGEEPLAGG